MTIREELLQQKNARVSRRTFVGGSAAAAVALSSGKPAAAAPSSISQRLARTQDDGPSIIIGTLGEAQSINPFLTNESEGDWRCKMLFDEFVRANAATFAPEPGIAESWSNEELTLPSISVRMPPLATAPMSPQLMSLSPSRGISTPTRHPHGK